ncbi:MAG: hypothetical protein LC754_03575 [Acidobacteria bacterium]|nr:hypothetical protein [Acidobacteriota bacterium]
MKVAWYSGLHVIAFLLSLPCQTKAHKTMHTGEEEIDLDELRQESQDAPESTAPLYFPRAIPLPPRILELLNLVQPISLCITIIPIFTELARVLNYLSLIENCLTEDKTLQKSTLIFKLVYEKTLSLLNYINEQALPVVDLNEHVRDVLDGMSFAIGHELHRVFRDEVPTLNTYQYSQISRAELIRAYGLLHNCFQQSTLTLARAFDPTLDGAQLFEDHKTKVEQSLVLYGELFSLLQKVNGAERASGVLPKHALVNHLEHFRDETMHFLIYRDWVEFEAFVDEIKKSYDDDGDLAPVLHRFGSYLEALIYHVSMRDVLRNQPALSQHLKPLN